jgi:hypothetical protein
MTTTTRRSIAVICIAELALVAGCREGAVPEPAPPKSATFFVSAVDSISIFDRKFFATWSVADPERQLFPPDIEVRSLNPSVVAVAEGVALDGVGLGTATIEVRRTADTLDRVRFNVRVGPPRMIFWVTTGPPFELGLSFRATVTDDYTKRPPVHWRSSDPTVVAIDTNFGAGPAPTLRTVGLGSAVITVASDRDTTIASSRPVQVVPVRAVSLSAKPFTDGVIHGVDQTTSVIVSIGTGSGALSRDLKPTVVAESPGIAVVDRFVADTSYDREYSTEVVFRGIGAGIAHFTFSIGGDSARVPITVRVGGADSAYAFAGRPEVLRVTANDFDAGNVVIVGLDSPRNGTVSLGSASTIVYTPKSGYVGRDSLRYVLSHQTGADTVPVRINVMPGQYSAIPVNPDASVTATDLNQAGEVVGTLRVGPGPSQAFRWSVAGNTLLRLPTPTDSSTGTAINDLGDVVGRLNTRPFLWRNDGSLPIDLDPDRTLSFPVAVDINNRVEVAFNSFNIWRNGRLEPVPRVGDCIGLAALNNRGDYVIEQCGRTFTYTHWQVRLASGGSYENRCYPGRYRAMTTFSDSAWVLGQDEDQRFGGGGTKPALHFAAGSCVQLSEVYDRRTSAASGLNNRGWVVGQLALPDGKTSAVLLVNRATIPLDALAPMAGWNFVVGRRVNDAGQILAEAIEIATGRRGTFLLSP